MNYLDIQTKKEEQYNQMFDTPQKQDWKFKYAKVPETTCPTENFDIPDVAGFIESQLQSK